MFQGGIREMKRSDIEAVKEIYALYWPEEDFRNRLISRAQNFLDQTPEIVPQKFTYFVADLNGQAVGVAGIRKAPQHMLDLTVTENPAELYILAAKNLQGGIGTALVNKILSYAREESYTEIVLYSGETHAQYWAFYDKIGFQRVRESVAPNGEKGMVWRKML